MASERWLSVGPTTIENALLPTRERLFINREKEAVLVGTESGTAGRRKKP